MTQTYESPELKRIQANIRLKLLKELKRVTNTSGSLQAYVDRMTDKSTVDCFITAFVKGHHYRDYPDIVQAEEDGIIDDDEATRTCFDLRDHWRWLSENPHMGYFMRFLTNVLAAMKKYKAQDITSGYEGDLISEIRDLQYKYCEEIVTNVGLDQESFPSHADYVARYGSHHWNGAWSARPVTPSGYGGNFTINEQMQIAIWDFMDELFSGSYTNEIILYMMGRTLCSCVKYDFGKYYFPYLMTPFPISFVTNYRIVEWTKYTGTWDDNYPDAPCKFDDHNLISIETNIQTTFGQCRYDKVVFDFSGEDDFNFGEGDNPLPGFSTATPRSTSRPRGRSRNPSSNQTNAGDGTRSDSTHRRGNTRAQSPDPPGPGSSSSNTNVPNDDNYHPDGMLSALARSMTTHIQSLTDMDMIHDHMTRFGTTNEGSVSVSRDSRRQGDYIVVARDRFGVRNYLVTYTRKNRKPIFNSMS